MARSMTVAASLALFVAICAPAGAQTGGQKKEQPILVGGYGVGMRKTCGEFVRETDERDAGKALESEGKTYYPERRLYFEWLSGFFTARSLAGQQVVGDRNMDDMVSWVRKYCEAHPLDQFLTAAIKLAAEVGPKPQGR